MSTRERLYSLIDEMTEEEQQAWFLILTTPKTRKQNLDEVNSVMGILHQYANPDLIPLEENASAEVAEEQERQFWEDYQNENA